MIHATKVSHPEIAAFGQARLAAITPYIRQKHHTFVRQESPRITALGRMENLFTVMAQELDAHMLKEEQVLFPHLEQLEEAFLDGKPNGKPI